MYRYQEQVGDGVFQLILSLHISHFDACPHKSKQGPAVPLFFDIFKEAIARMRIGNISQYLAVANRKYSFKGFERNR